MVVVQVAAKVPVTTALEVEVAMALVFQEKEAEGPEQ